MVRVLRRLRQLRHVDVVLGPLGVPRVDVGARDAAGLRELREDGLELRGVQEAGVPEELEFRADGGEGAVGGGGVGHGLFSGGPELVGG